MLKGIEMKKKIGEYILDWVQDKGRLGDLYKANDIHHKPFTIRKIEKQKYVDIHKKYIEEHKITNEQFCLDLTNKVRFL